jgi:hypothetical protein
MWSSTPPWVTSPWRYALSCWASWACWVEQEVDDVVAEAVCQKLSPLLKKDEQRRMQNGRGGGWESFLLERHLRVLLVEDDDST